MRILIFVWIFLVVGGCISSLEIGPVPFKARLVVDGLLTDQPGQHFITLSTSAPTHSPDSTTRVSGASISLHDDVGGQWNYTEVTNGRYRISDVQGVVGRSYHIEIQLDDEPVVYRSTPQRMTNAGEISDLYAKVKTFTHGPENSLKDYSFEVNLNATNDSKGEHFLRWRTVGTYEIGTQPELATKPNPSSPMAPEIPDPHPCSGYVYDDDDGLVRVGQCTCCQCWITEYSSSAIIADNSVTQHTYSDVLVATIPIDKFRFYRKYHLEVQQMSVSEEVYRFWQRVKSQEATGSIFQANISKVKGNIYNASDSEDIVFGVFAVSAVTTETITLLRSDAPELLPSLDGLTAPCYQLIRGATNVKPPFW
ncbi:MAG TPA: DUF4249 domain-containing protein [Chryseosolibacter sp.]|nr:DUF4249 domain-containing protein [Chryseosolibacter sp.]